MNLLSQNNLIRLVSIFGFIGACILVFSTKDTFYLLFVLISTLAFGATFFKKNLEYKIKPVGFEFKKPAMWLRLFKKNFIWIYCGLAVLFYLLFFTNQNVIAFFDGLIKKNLPEVHNFFNLSPQGDEVSPTPIPTSTPYPTVIQPTRGYIDPDPIVSCGPGERSGQYIQDRRSNCINYVDCGLNNNTVWALMLKSECDIKHMEQGSNNNQQNNQQLGNSPNLVPVFMSYYGFSFYCPPQNVDAAKNINATMESKKSQWASDFNACYSSQTKNDSCYIACNNARDIERSACGSSDYANCSQQASDNWLACVDACPSLVDQCDWVYSESNSLSEQLENLCK